MRPKTIPFVISGIAVAIAILGSIAGLLDSWSLRTSDRLFLARPADKNVVIVAIDDGSLAKIGRWPWPRDIHANIIRKLSGHDVKAIGYDVNFPEPSDPAKDKDLADAIHEAGNVVLPIELNTYSDHGKLFFTSVSSVQSIADIQTQTKAVGLTNLPLDVDNVSRRAPLKVSSKDGSEVESFAAQVAMVAGKDLSDLKSLDEIHIAFPNHPGKAFRIISVTDLLDDSKDWSSLKDAAVFVGATARDLHDAQLVPTSDGEPMPGVEIHASIYDTISNHIRLNSAPIWTEIVILLVIALLLSILIPFLRPRFSLISILVLWILVIVGAFVFFDRGLIIDMVWPTLLIVFGSVALFIERWVSTDKQKKEIRTAFTHYVSPSVVDSLLKNPDRLKLGGERRRMTVLFSDLRGFTTLSEGLSPEKLVEVLNKYLHEMTSIVFAEQGVLDKYIGDAVMAFWNAPLDQSDHAIRAVRTAIKMRDKLKDMNKTGAFPPGIELKVGVGMNSGDMVVGNIGADMRFDYTVIGDAVNLASRTESLCKEYGVEIIVTENTVNDLQGHFLLRKLDKVAVKGKKEPIMIYQVICLKDQITPEALHHSTLFEKALQQYFDRQFDIAIATCQEVLKSWPDDVAAQNLIKHSEIYLSNPPSSEWDGTWVMTKK